MNVLAFESSCDETSAAVVAYDGEKFTVKSNIVASQIEVHRLYGGVVPEIASRAHIEAISSITYEALEVADVSLSDIDLVAVTANPGLIGALLVGVNFAKALAAVGGKSLATRLDLVPLMAPALACAAAGLLVAVSVHVMHALLRARLERTLRHTQFK